jgi:hypothetical protein
MRPKKPPTELQSSYSFRNFRLCVTLPSSSPRTACNDVGLRSQERKRGMVLRPQGTVEHFLRYALALVALTPPVSFVIWFTSSKFRVRICTVNLICFINGI